MICNESEIHYGTKQIASAAASIHVKAKREKTFKFKPKKCVCGRFILFKRERKANG